MAFLVVAPAVASAAPGDLDLTFSGDGKQTTDLGFGFSSATAIVRQPNGKVVAVGGDRAHGDGDFALARYNTDGSLDTSFSGDGKQTTDFGGADVARGVAIQGNGKIVVVGGVAGGDAGSGFALARYNTDGSLDTSFSGDGRQTTHFAIEWEDQQANGVVLQDDGKIVAGGVVGDGAPIVFDSFALARYNPNGSLDTSFSGDGTQTTGFGSGTRADGVALQGDGKIVAVGRGGAGNDFALARYTPNGSLDTSFSGDGRQTTNFGGDDGANGVALQGNGRIVTVGSGGGGGDFALARYNANGSLDASFSGDGKQTTNFGGVDSANGVALQGNGKIVAVGRGGTVGDFALARYNPNGSLDTSFSGDGRQRTNFGGSDAASGVALQGNGKIVAGGVRGGAGSDFALARYNRDGSLDTSFSGDGRQRTSFGGFGDGATAVALQGDGKIVAVGTAPDFALARYNRDGSLDTSFSGDGRQRTSFGDTDMARGVALQGDGKIVVIGSGSNGGDFELARYNADGSLDTGFSGDGKQTTAFGSFAVASGVALQGNGKIVVVGYAGGDFALARYNANGSLDKTFSGDGKQTTDFGDSETGAAVALQGNGKIVAVGQVHYGDFTDDFALARYNTDGSLDTGFSGDGKQTTDFGDFDTANGVALQGDGKIVVVGSVDVTPFAFDFALARYNPNGSLDTSFSGDGKQTTDFGDFDSANGVVLQGDGKIVAAGGTGFDFALARYNTTGSLDTSFSGDGKQTTDFGDLQFPAGARGVAIQGDGNIVAAGIGVGSSGTTDFALARYLGG